MLPESPKSLVEHNQVGKLLLDLKPKFHDHNRKFDRIPPFSFSIDGISPTMHGNQDHPKEHPGSFRVLLNQCHHSHNGIIVLLESATSTEQTGHAQTDNWPCPWPTSSCGTCHRPWRPSFWPPWTSGPQQSKAFNLLNFLHKVFGLNKPGRSNNSNQNTVGICKTCLNSVEIERD